MFVSVYLYVYILKYLTRDHVIRNLNLVCNQTCVVNGFILFQYTSNGNSRKYMNMVSYIRCVYIIIRARFVQNYNGFNQNLARTELLRQTVQKCLITFKEQHYHCVASCTCTVVNVQADSIYKWKIRETVTICILLEKLNSNSPC